jgi:hypothetical protein
MENFILKLKEALKFSKYLTNRIYKEAKTWNYIREQYLRVYSSCQQMRQTVPTQYLALHVHSIVGLSVIGVSPNCSSTSFHMCILNNSDHRMWYRCEGALIDLFVGASMEWDTVTVTLEIWRRFKGQSPLLDWFSLEPSLETSRPIIQC